MVCTLQLAHDLCFLGVITVVAETNCVEVVDTFEAMAEEDGRIILVCPY